MAGTVFVKNGKVEPQRDNIKLVGAHGGYRPNRDGSGKEKGRALKELDKEITDLNNGHEDIGNMLSEVQVDDKRDPMLDRVAASTPNEETARENGELDDELQRARKTMNKDRDLANYVNGADKIFADRALDVKKGRK